MNLHKIGAVSSLSGVPTATLRIWEARYQAFSPMKSDSRHRLYSDDDVLKATLIKRLTDQGHGIRQLVQCSLQELNQLLQQHKSAAQYLSASTAISTSSGVAIVGLALASRIESPKFKQHLTPNTIDMTEIFAKMEDLLKATRQELPQLLLIQCPSLHAGVQNDIRRLVDKTQAKHVIVLYSFGQEAVIESLKQLGMVVRREPLPDLDLSELIKSSLMRNLRSASTPHLPSSSIPPRKYDDLALMRVAGISTKVLCECPHHVAELLTQLARFEQYSFDCLNKSSEDARIHAHLSAVSGTARALFEEALEMVAQHEGIDLQSLVS
jgi:DNA-binding transcriptional MerR regulator